MSVTANDIIKRSMQALGILGRTESPGAGESNDGLIAFNAMLDSWSNGEDLMSYVVLERSAPLSVNTASYTIGTGGTINVARPADIKQAYIRDAIGNNFLLEILPRDKWNQIGNRSSTITSQIPETLFYDPQYPLGVINIFPTPLLAYTLFFDSTQDQVDFSSLTQALAMPPGYERAYVLNLALELMAAGFPCMLDDKALMRLINNAADAKANVKRVNIKEVIADYDSAIVSHANSTYNVYRGE